MVMDDILWQQAFVAHRRHIEEVVPGQTIVGPKEKRLWRLFRMGLVDPSPGDRPRPDATRSMRYAAIVGEGILELVQQERGKVRVSIPFVR